MAAGEMRHRVQIQRLVESSPTEFGSIAATWQTLETRWANIQPRGRVPGEEVFSGQQVSSNATHKIVMRYWEGADGSRLTPKMRLYWPLRNRYFNVEAVNNEGEQAGTSFMTVYVVEQS